MLVSLFFATNALLVINSNQQQPTFAANARGNMEGSLGCPYSIALRLVHRRKITAANNLRAAC
jgi:hypothetical protein